MPMYTYVCRDCVQPFERKLRMSQAGDSQACPTCGSMNTRKTIGKVAVGGISRSAAPAISVPPAGSPFT